MSRSDGQSEARPPLFESPSKLGTHLSTHCNRDLAQPVNRTRTCGVEARYATTRPLGRPASKIPVERQKKNLQESIDREEGKPEKRELVFADFLVKDLIREGKVFYRSCSLLIGKSKEKIISPKDGDRFNSCQVIYSQFGLAIHQNDHQARRRFVEWAQNEIAVVPDFHKRILFSDEAHFWLNGYVNKQNCRIWSEANPQVYVETPLHPEKLTVWCALWACGIIGPYFFQKR
ncbi:hypothetical protein TNCV_1919231 [Trichonephila clavipes]|nr:hypothetical protein TNCV_1919231 [Trichonephila clavipes]